jgi:hypothetical protein
MVASQLRQELSPFGETDRSPRLGWLVASTRDYLKNLNRFHPSQT